MMRKYPMLRFAANVDWQHVEPALLRKLNELGAKTNNIISIFSGYRTDKYSASVGGFAGDPHTRHIAVDANIGGKPIGSVIKPSQFAAVGLITGNQPNFYKGKPDPSHVQLGTSQGGGAVATSPAPAQAPAPVAASTTGPVVPNPQPTQDDTLADATSTQPFEPPPGSGINSTNQFVASLWNRIQATSPDTQLLADNAQMTGG